MSLALLAPALAAAAAFGNDRINWNPSPGGVGPNNQAFTCGAGSNRILFVTFAGESLNTISGITYGGVAMTRISNQLTASNRTSVVYYLVNPASGSNTIATSWSPGYFNPLLASAFTYNGVDTSNPFGTTGSNGINSGTTWSVTVTAFAPASTLGTVIQILMFSNGQAGLALSTNQGSPRSLYQANMNNTGGIGLCDWNPASTASVSVANYVTKTGSPSGANNFITLYVAELNIVPTPTSTVTPSITPTWTVSPTCTASPTASPTSTPSMPLLKSANVTAADFGETVTYSFNYSNDSGNTVTMSIWDTVPAMIQYLGCDNACSQAGGLVQWSIPGVGPGASGTVSFWGVIASFPALPWSSPWQAQTAWSPLGPAGLWRPSVKMDKAGPG